MITFQHNTDNKLTASYTKVKPKEDDQVIDYLCRKDVVFIGVYHNDLYYPEMKYTYHYNEETGKHWFIDPERYNSFQQNDTKRGLMEYVLSFLGEGLYYKFKSYFYIRVFQTKEELDQWVNTTEMHPTETQITEQKRREGVMKNLRDKYPVYKKISREAKN
jgi:hypothetical protein